MFDLDAAVVDRGQAGLSRQLVSFQVVHADLLPQAFCAYVNGFFGQRQHVFAAAKNIDHVHRLRYVKQAGIHRFAQNLLASGGVARVDGNDLVAVRLHVLGGKKAGPVPLGRQADHGDGFTLPQQIPERAVVVVHG